MITDVFVIRDFWHLQDQVYNWTEKRFVKAALRFWKRVDISDPDGCWNWKGHLNKGYGQFSFGKCFPLAAHRAACIFSGIKLSSEKNVVCHTCDNPSCVKPDHLYAGDMLDNRKDMVSRERAKEFYCQVINSNNCKKLDVELLSAEPKYREISKRYKIKYVVLLEHALKIRGG